MRKPAIKNIEVEREAQRLVAQRGISAIDYVKAKIEDRKAIGDEPNRAFWENIRRRVEAQLFEPEE